MKALSISKYLGFSIGLFNLLSVGIAQAIPNSFEDYDRPSLWENPDILEVAEISEIYQLQLPEVADFISYSQFQTSYDSQSDRELPTSQATSSEEIEKAQIPRETSPNSKSKPKYRAAPNIAIISPSAYGASWGQVGIGFAYVPRQRYRSGSDADDSGAGIVFGLGDPQKYVGLQVGIGFTNADNLGDGRLHLKLHRRLSKDMGVAVGVRGIGEWGRESDAGSSVYGVFTSRFHLKENPSEPFSAIYTSIGVGGGQFRSEDDILDGTDSVGVFGGVALRVVPQMNLITEWNGQDLGIGLSIIPFENLPCAINPSVVDVTGNAGDGSRFILGVGCSYKF